MEKIKLEKVKLLEKEVQDLINDFSKKRKKYEKMKNRLQFATICVGAGTSLVLGLSFISEISDICKILGFILSAITTIVTGYLHIHNFEQKCRQRTITYLKLLELKRDLKFEDDLSVDEFNIYKKRLSTIMNEDSELYLNQLDEKNVQQEK